jgi:hypothetical protein
VVYTAILAGGRGAKLYPEPPMAHELMLIFDGRSFKGAIDKVDRSEGRGCIDVDIPNTQGLK